MFQRRADDPVRDDKQNTAYSAAGVRSQNEGDGASQRTISSVTQLWAELSVAVRVSRRVEITRTRSLRGSSSAGANSYCVQLRVKQASTPCRLHLWSAQLDFLDCSFNSWLPRVVGSRVILRKLPPRPPTPSHALTRRESDVAMQVPSSHH
ncbi:hypothetical protein JZ751_009253 [Albula glossodonta]|uniref:Uncharacterized protein n=1 Tax=Albula glossodonta TaxID=121402 RepID=A0A8T2N620_9TELE|nr:hypothetical protein JZ751_009253 [Albula glossodonta]